VLPGALAQRLDVGKKRGLGHGVFFFPWCETFRRHRAGLKTFHQEQNNHARVEDESIGGPRTSSVRWRTQHGRVFGAYA
jgi:hypothetical protein